MSVLMTKLRDSGYSRQQRWEILKSGTRKFTRMVEQEKGGVRRVNRPRWEGGRNRYVKKLLSKRNWYKRRRESKEGTKGEGRGETEVERKSNMGEETEPESIMFIPSTPNGELMKRLKEADATFRKGSSIRQIKLIERADI